LHHAARLGFAELVQGLATRDIADIDQRDRFGRTPLCIGCEAGRVEIVQELLGKGADLAIPSDHGRTPLYSASWNGHIEVVRLLLERGADLAVPNKNGVTPLNAASNSG
ncbi:ankyrin repeat protein, partial [Diaporthe sp. PMI_573]